MDQLRIRTDASLDFLGQLIDSERALLFRLGKRRVFAKKEYIFKAGQTEQTVYVVIRGCVKISGSTAEGRNVLLWFSISGEILGLAGSLQLQPQLIYALAVGPCEVLCIPQLHFEEWLRTRPDIAISLIRILAARVREFGRRFLATLASGNILVEIAQLLIQMGETYGVPDGRHVCIAIPLTEQDIADMIGASRQGVSSCLAKMKRAGKIGVMKRYLTIKDSAYLHSIANGYNSRRTPLDAPC